MTNDCYLPLKDWLERDFTYPTKNAFYNWCRPGPLRDELVRAGVLMQIGRRWLMNRAKFEQWCEAKAKEQSNAAAKAEP